ncbi:hypothetical protein PAXRUDRAFT_133996 [Paxillus rubicundulus Ve08.2h10]|uniref:Unplaced genomic scaffold scaffold_67, whole genome shotgun sequence n=1 Tax=Paxillus rubicundulus Ve08.2h10 TaxID=930991 RepID=A0A0D0E345_9AGAM|nr:hypothetical protein PAXRUDRAFT_133996 [Paxillus rubicundulus Ve08.2h10]
MPDISWYKGIKFKRLPNEARENSFFSRALGGMRSVRKAQVSGREWKGKMAERGVSKDRPVQLLSSIVEPVREKGQGQEGDIKMQDTTPVLADVRLGRLDPSSSSASAAIPFTPAPEKTAVPASEEQGALSGAQNPSSVAESSLQAIQSSVREMRLASQEPQPSTQGSQPLVAPNSSRPIIAPPRVPRPHTPINLADTIDRVRRDRLKAIGNGSGSRFSSETPSVTTKNSAIDGEDGVSELGYPCVLPSCLRGLHIC